MSPPGSMATNAPSGLLCHPHPPVADAATIEPPSRTEVTSFRIADLLWFCRPLPPKIARREFPYPRRRGTAGGLACSPGKRFVTGRSARLNAMGVPAGHTGEHD